MSPIVLKPGQDALEWARTQLDFESVSKSAPTTKSILLKAQTMVPLARPLNWKRKGSTAGAVALAALLCFAPWLPVKTQLVAVSFTLEKALTLSQAQNIALRATRALPDNILARADYGSAAPLALDTGGGAVNLRFGISALDLAPAKVEELGLIALDDAIEGTPELNPTRPNILKRTQWLSPAGYIKHLARGHAERRSSAEGYASRLRQGLLDNQVLLNNGLSRYLGQAGFRLVRGAYTGTGAGTTAEGYDFTVQAWPQPYDIAIQDFKGMTEREQNGLRKRCEEFFTQFNLASATLLAGQDPTAWAPIVVHVADADGTYDSLLTNRVQAALDQPDAVDLATLQFDVVDRVERALEQTLPGQLCRVDYETILGDVAAGRVKYYRVNITLTGNTVKHEQYRFKGEDDLENETSIDW